MSVSATSAARHGVSFPDFQWLFLLVWPVGYALTYTALPDFAFQYFALSLLALLSCGLSLSALNAPLDDSLPIWVILLVFIFAYYIEFYLLVLDPSILEAFFAPTKITQIDIAAYFDSYLAATSAFLTTSLISIIYLKRSSSQGRSPNRSSYNSSNDRALWQLGVTFALIVLASSALAYKFNLIRSGDRDLLPFHLEGLVDYIRLETAPLLIVLIIQRAIVNKRRNWIIAGVVMLLTFALSDMVLRTSKGTFVSMTFTLMFLRLITGEKPSRKQITGGLLLILIGLTFFPIFLFFRTFRTQGMSIGASLHSSAQQLLEFGQMPLAITYLYRILVLRLTGAGALLTIALRHVHPLGSAAWDAFWGPRSWTGYIDMEIFNISPKYVDYFGIAPSLVGLFYVVDGIAGAAIGCAGLFALTLYGWRLLGRLGATLGPASRAVYLEIVLWVVMDGNATLQLAKELVVFSASLLLAYWLCKFDLLSLVGLSQPKLNSRTPQSVRVGG